MSKLVVIVGETASGKSALAMKLARKFNGEIISADSWAVYKDFNIGTAKPSYVDRKHVTHHLLDITDPKKGFNVAEFKKKATKTINNLDKLGKLPILVGGTGLYIDSVIYDYGFLPAGNPKDRHKLNSLPFVELKTIVEKKRLDIQGIDMRNKRRIIRLIESAGERPTKSSLRSDTLLIGLNTDSKTLEHRIRSRVDKMLAAGLEKEAEALSQRYEWQIEPMKGIGYREWQTYFNGSQSLDQTREQIVRSTIKLAKKQRTWFKRNKSIHWVNSPVAAERLVDMFLNK